ncbi:sodium:solute symporter family protein [Phanerochaete sordida]|uniref:Sodium:solute symporter family protein n=1 Tax=Phanerochaete sordida TaxID=48140 RepID=A0A9P3G873_9APHY|nr:sodium:solute symporter family protein [Phanerochaete sordida]
MSSPVPPALPQGAGYALCAGLGLLFAGAMWHTVRALARARGEVQGSELFMTAARSVGPGLVAGAVVSSWTVAGTLLTSCTWTFSYGVSGAYFYGAGILMFSVAAIELKRKAPGAHTFLELTKIRYGVPGHCIQIFYSTLVQLFNCVNLLVGGSAVFSSITGMHPIASCFLLPIGVVVYTVTGGIKATFLVDYMHTVVIYVIILIALFSTYATSPLIGSPDKMYTLLAAAAESSPAPGAPGGSYLSFHSVQSLVLGIVIFVTGWSATVDVQLFQKAIAADPAHTLGGYLLGGLCWFAIPFCLATTFGLVGRALQTDAAWPTFPRLMSVDEVNKGLVLPYAAQALLGKGGAVLVLLMIFMAVTSAFSSDLVCIASVVTYDIYRGYINPRATGKRLLKLSHFVVIGFATVCACIAAGLSQTAIGVNFIITSIGIVTAPAFFPIACTLLWRKQNTIAVVLAPILGTATGIGCWVGSTHHWYSALTIDTLGEPLPLVVGNAVSLFSPFIYSPLLTVLFGAQDFRWEKFGAITAVDDSDVTGITSEQLAEQTKAEEPQMDAATDARMKRASLIAAYWSIAVTLAFIIVLPMPLYGTRYVFSRPFFRLWVVWTFAWAWAAALIITLLPLWQGRRTLWLVMSYAFTRRSAVVEPSSPAERQGSEEIEEKKASSDAESAAQVMVVPVR